MTLKALFPAGSETVANNMRLSPGIVSNGHVFLTGVTGSMPEGMPDDPAIQFRAAFTKVAAVLAEAGLTFDAVVEMTSYHIDIDAYFEVFSDVRADFVTPPYPAWTAVEVAKLRRPGALVEIRVVAAMEDNDV